MLKLLAKVAEKYAKSTNTACGVFWYVHQPKMPASLIKKDVKLIFCNHYDTKFDPNVHISESLAHQLILRGFKDGEDVTQAVKEIYKIK